MAQFDQFKGIVVQLVRALPCQGRSCGFESRQSRLCLFVYSKIFFVFMPRHPVKKKRILLPDPVFNSISVHMLVNRVMKSGKKSLAYKIVYTTLKEIG